ncbi:unnamed protein product [Nippostrongylus brasiliensis]|uniref:ENTH domain-containing protein n=1 Tax=Nippostrongylus brasiliensis TaxID=27835 RepID=A0A0N4YCV2_NIPBR|nr:hypothetical protein Q1695_001001 [Nippostrongylus brasiliensis]VDL77992.1 unnamed protein product [Nippostrongylus brasiliensis]
MPTAETALDTNFTLSPIEPVLDENTTGFLTNITETIDGSFPEPSLTLTTMVEAAKDFVRKYMTTSQWLNMKKLLRVIKEIGGERRDLHRAVSIYLGRVLSEEKRRDIENRKDELEATFSSDFRKV